MCISADLIDERLDRLLAFTAACRQLAVANSEAGSATFSGVEHLLAEVERGLTDFGTELKSSCKGGENAGNKH